ncbi:hypothetical protein ABID08_005300 [Rhizobium binae]|uniref:Uncharacterized protein n=1 Tax=Rhizobium binae TaxID=1138190 RepID=A0ABV2MN86_9HYPH
MSKTTNKFSPEVRAPAKIGCTAQTFSGRGEEGRVDNGPRLGLPSDVAERMKALERRTVSFGWPTRFCAERQHFSRWRSSTAH